MPNWVSNYVEVIGSADDVAAFVEKAGKPYETQFRDFATDQTLHESPLSFWNFVEPENKESYFGGGWYEWNIAHWGVKWDATDVEYNGTRASESGKTVASFVYNTAWSIPEDVMVAMVEQHPTLTFEFDCEEEQGWGAKYLGENGTLTETESWDIPDSHADYVARGREDSCVCGYSTNTEDYYDDCPTKKQEYLVKIESLYRVSATSEESAWEMFENGVGVAEEEADYRVVVVVDRDGKRVFPKL